MRSVVYSKSICATIILFICFPSYASNVTNAMLETYLQLSSTRQEVLSENIANSSKPNYKVKEIEMPKNFRQLSKFAGTNSQLNMKVTSSSHIRGSKPNRRFKSKLDKKAKNFKPNGNNVDLPDQLSKANNNQISYDQAVKAFQLTNSLITTALGNSGGAR